MMQLMTEYLITVKQYTDKEEEHSVMGMDSAHALRNLRGMIGEFEYIGSKKA